VATHSSQTVGLFPCFSLYAVAHDSSFRHFPAGSSCHEWLRKADTSPRRQRFALWLRPVSAFEAKSSKLSSAKGSPRKVRRAVASACCGS